MNNESFNVSLKDFLNDLKEIGINVDKYWLGIGSWDNDTYRLDLSENTGEYTCLRMN